MKPPKTAQLRKLLRFMEERQRIYVKRLAGEPWPWTGDHILRKYRFCNVYRENDKVTQWLRTNWREPYDMHKNLWFAMCIARQINWPDTLHDIGFPETWNPRRVLKALDARKARGEKIYSSAYLLGGGCPKGMSKSQYIVMNVLNPLWKSYQKNMATQAYNPHHPWHVDCVWRKNNNSCVTLQAAFEYLLEFHGWGKFLAYEVVTDLRHTRYLREAPDIYSWANIGPGAQRGLNRLYERKVVQSHQQSQLLEELLEVMWWLQTHADPKLFPSIEARDTEHCLCELDKYLRAEERIKYGEIIGLERFVAPGLVMR